MVELDQLPLYELQTMYFLFWKEREAEKEAESKMTDEQKAGAAVGRLIEDNI